MDKAFVENIKKVYNLLQDDLSKQIWGCRLMHSLTGDSHYIRKIMKKTDNGNELYAKMKKTDKDKVIFGVGMIGKRLLDIFDNITFSCFVDNNHAGETYKGLPVINIETLKKDYSDAFIVISSRVFHSEILKQLLTEGFKEENIINIGETCDRLSRLQYFDLPDLKTDINGKEIFVDGGCYDGKNSFEFKKWCNNSGVKETFIYAWEPDPKTLQACKSMLDANQCRYKIIDKGLWSEKDTLCFTTADTSSAICENGTVHIEVDSIDNIISEPITYIKMDVEGAEYKALLGAEKTIKKYKPKLAICIYHKPEDVWEIPMLIHKINPNYRFYVRHYSLTTPETILYAIDESGL